jgi:hypothetical protein
MQVNQQRSRRLAVGTGLALCVAAAAAVRLALLDDWLNYDESVNYMIGKSGSWADFVFQFSSRAHPPLSYLLTMPFLALGSSALLARMAALVCGLAGVGLGWVVLREALRDGSQDRPDPGLVLLGTLFLGLTPIFVVLSIEVRGYALCLVFIWVSLWLALRLRAGRGDWRDHLALAAASGLALFTEFAAAFHVAALSLWVHAPPLWRGLRRGDWGRAARSALPQVAVFALAGLDYAWQRGGRRAEFGHTRHALYDGSLGDPAAVMGFLWERLPAQMDGILPNPWGLAALALLLVAWTPLTARSPLARRARELSAQALLALGLVFAASLLRLFPLGGLARHGVAIAPGVLLAAFVAATACVQHAVRPGVRRRLAAAAVGLALAPGLALGLLAARPDGTTREQRGAVIGVPDFQERPGPVLTNAEGRALLSWWFLPGRSPRRLYQDVTRMLVFDYDGISVVEPIDTEAFVRTAVFYAERAGVCWVFLAFPRGGEEARRTYAELVRALHAHPGAELALHRRQDWLLDTVVMRVDSPRVARRGVAP